MSKGVQMFCAVVAICALSAPAARAAEGQQYAFLHEPHHGAQHDHSRGCFVTLSPTDHTRGIRHWRNPCPHKHRKDMNPYHRGYHKLYPHH